MARLKHERGGARWPLFVLAAVLLAAGIAGCARESTPSSLSPGARPSAGPGTVGSNVRFADYAGSAVCARCHASEAASWGRSPMHNMTREARTAEIKGPFDGTVYHFQNDTALLQRAGADRFVTLSSKRFGGGIYRVTRVIGGRHREDYAGVPVAAVREGAPAVGDPTEEVVLPISYLLGSRTLRYKGYSVMVKERDGLRAGPVWNQTCIFCHNTVPYLSTVLGALEGSGKREAVYQGEVVDPLLPPQLRATYAVTDPRALGEALHDEIARLGGSGTPSLRGAITTTRSRFRAKHLVEVGIGCESCHLGARDHVRDPMRLPSFEPVSPAFAVRLPSHAPPPAPGRPEPNAKASERAATLNRVCARCHQVLFSGYDPTWEGGSRRGSPGGSHINSGEARDMILGACASKLACVDCHDPHAADAAAGLATLEPAKEDALCARCHQDLAAPDALRAHSHHDPGGAGARCVACHMPRKNLSLDGRLSRYHRIGSPTDPAKVLLDRPLECALCHVDKPARVLVQTMESWWKKSYERGALEKLYGSLDANVILATAERGKPHEQAVAFFLLGERRVKAAAPVLTGQLTHPYPLVRGYAQRALEAISGHALPIDTDGDLGDQGIERAAKESSK
jgi:predicted CXXCH cytochrome family protein